MLTGGNREKDICSINLRVVLNYYFGLNVSHHNHPHPLLISIGQPHDCETVFIPHIHQHPTLPTLGFIMMV